MTTIPSSSEAESKPIDRVLAGLSYRAYSRGYIARCSAHRDRHASLMVWEDPVDEHVGLKCFAGCSRKAIVEALGLTESDLYVQQRSHVARAVIPGITMIDLAIDKLIHPNVLLTLGVEDTTYRGQQAIRIPYHNQDGTERERFRVRAHRERGEFVEFRQRTACALWPSSFAARPHCGLPRACRRRD